MMDDQPYIENALKWYLCNDYYIDIVKELMSNKTN
jgi:hypothetical protein